MKVSIILKLALIIPVVASSAVQSMTLNYRHEYLDDTEQHADRIRISHRLENKVGFALEGKWGSKSVTGESNIYENNYSKGHEFELNYSYKVNDKFTLAPAAIIDSSSNATTYKFQVKGIYALTDSLYTAARYRYGVQNYTSSVSDDRHFHQGNFNLGYRLSWGTVEYDFEYKDTDYADFRGKNNTYLHNLVIQAPINKSWTPFAEIGYVPYRNADIGGYVGSDGSTYNNDFQIRYRVGIKYDF